METAKVKLSQLRVLHSGIKTIALALCPSSLEDREDMCQLMNEYMLRGHNLTFAKYRAIDWLRSRAYQNSYHGDVEHVRIEVAHSLPAKDRARETDVRIQLDQLLGILDKDDEALIRFSVIEGRTLAELANRFQVTRSALSKRRTKIFRMLKGTVTSSRVGNKDYEHEIKKT